MIYFFRFLITTSLLILVYIFYKSEISWEGGNRNYYLIYYIGTLLAIVLLVIITYLKVQTQKYIVIIFTSIIFTFYSFEIKLIFDQKKNLNFDTRSGYEVYEDLKKNNLNVTIASQPANYLNLKELDLLSLAGISKTKTIFCNENGYYAIYNSDRFGFNNPDEEWDSKEIEYFIVGDSFTHGACVNRPDDIASVLRQYSKKNVLNLGQMGNGPLMEYATLREYLAPNTKNVLWLYFEGNDLWDLENELKNNILNKYLTNQNFKQDLKIKQTQIDQFIKNYIEIKIEDNNLKNRIIKFIKLYNTRYLLFTRSQPIPQSPTPELMEILKLANELVASYGGRLYFVYLPSFERYKKLLKVDSKQEIKETVINLGIKFVDIDEEVFLKEKNPLQLFPFEKKGHYTVEGYKKVALKIHEKNK